jgi:hypothetical protein
MHTVITALVVMPDGARRPTIVSRRTVSPSEIIQIMEQLKLEMGFSWVEEIIFPPTEAGVPKWVGTEDNDALTQMAVLAGGGTRMQL